jgi:hypothetical protein
LAHQGINPIHKYRKFWRLSGVAALHRPPRCPLLFLVQALRPELRDIRFHRWRDVAILPFFILNWHMKQRLLLALTSLISLLMNGQLSTLNLSAFNSDTCCWRKLSQEKHFMEACDWIVLYIKENPKENHHALHWHAGQMYACADANALAKNISKKPIRPFTGFSVERTPKLGITMQKELLHLLTTNPKSFNEFWTNGKHISTKISTIRCLFD